LSIDDLQDDVEIIDIDIENMRSQIHFRNELDNKSHEIKTRKLQRKRQALQNTIASYKKKLTELETEADFFLNAFLEMEKIEPLKPFDDMQTNAQLWNERYYQDLQLRLLLQKPLDLELVKCILCLDKSTPIRAELINILDQIQNKALTQQSAQKIGSDQEKNDK
jgi:hypothetical protein